MEEPKIEKSGDVIEKYPSGQEHSSTEPEYEFYIDPAKETKLLAKLDLGLIWIIMLLYLSCFLDRSNIGRCSDPPWKATEHC
jgi:hypothetical protein